RGYVSSMTERRRRGTKLVLWREFGPAPLALSRFISAPTAPSLRLSAVGLRFAIGPPALDAWLENCGYIFNGNFSSGAKAQNLKGPAWTARLKSVPFPKP